MSHLFKIFHVLYLKTKVGQYHRSKQMSLALTQKKQTPGISLIDYSSYLWLKYCECGCMQTLIRSNLNKRFVRWLFIQYKIAATSGTFSNYVATSLLGFIGGVFVTYFYFTFATLVVDLSIHTSWYSSVGLCIFLTIGLAFSSVIRCIFLSALPEIFTRKVRNILISYALLLLVAGPGANILYNTRQLTQTITCTKDQLAAVSHNLTEIYMKPLRALKRGITDLMNKMKPIVEKIKAVLVSIKNTILAIARIIQTGLSWLQSLAGLCNNKVGSPYDRCVRAIDRAVADCKVRIWSYIVYLCDVARIAAWVCQSFKLLSLICFFTPKINFNFFNVIEEKIEELERFMKAMLYVSVNFHHSFSFETNSSKTLKKVLQDTLHSEERRLTSFFSFLGAAKFLVGAYVLFIVFSTFVYRNKFRTQLHYDNYHINKYIISLDRRRAAAHRQTIFPLTLFEKTMYVSLFSLRFTSQERLHIVKDSVFIMTAAVKTVFLLLIDFALHWVLRLLDEHGRLTFNFGDEDSLVKAEGSGIWWYFHSVINNILKPWDVQFHFDTSPCLPEPIHPAYHTYERVANILLISMFTVLFQPFGLRFRSYVMSNFFPDAARRRAIWLFNHILMGRTNLTRYIRSQLKKKSSFGVRMEKLDFRQILLSKFPRLALILPYKNISKQCTVCGYGKPKETCITPDCPGIYCKDCLVMLHNICMVCNMPQKIEQFDISEEEDSEEDVDVTENVQRQERKAKKSWWKFWIIPHNIQGHTSLRDVEDGALKLEVSVYEELLPTEVSNTTTSNYQRDYFGDRWRINHWASLDDYLLPLPDISSWTPPQYQRQPTDNTHSSTGIDQ